MEKWQVYTTPNEAVDHRISIASRWLSVSRINELQADARRSTLLSPKALLSKLEGTSNFMMSSIEAFPSFNGPSPSPYLRWGTTTIARNAKTMVFRPLPLQNKLIARQRADEQSQLKEWIADLLHNLTTEITQFHKARHHRDSEGFADT